MLLALVQHLAEDFPNFVSHEPVYARQDLEKFVEYLFSTKAFSSQHKTLSSVNCSGSERSSAKCIALEGGVCKVMGCSPQL